MCIRDRAYKTRLQFIGEKFLKAELPLDLYKRIENNFAERLAAEEENQFMIDVKWAKMCIRDSSMPACCQQGYPQAASARPVGTAYSGGSEGSAYGSKTGIVPGVQGGRGDRQHLGSGKEFVYFPIGGEPIY